jgi:threonine/homoserine/homoserine lactone efflux protein
MRERILFMADFHQLLAFCAMSLLLSAVPGPSVLFVIGRALAHGRRTALASVLGNALGGDGGGGSVRAGFVVGVTNPKSVIFLAAVLPQFVDPEPATPASRRSSSAWPEPCCSWSPTASGG